MVNSRYIEPQSSGYRLRTLVLYIDYRPGDRSITYTYIRKYLKSQLNTNMTELSRFDRSLISSAATYT